MLAPPSYERLLHKNASFTDTDKLPPRKYGIRSTLYVVPTSKIEHELSSSEVICTGTNTYRRLSYHPVRRLNAAHHHSSRHGSSFAIPVCHAAPAPTSRSRTLHQDTNIYRPPPDLPIFMMPSYSNSYCAFSWLIVTHYHIYYFTLTSPRFVRLVVTTVDDDLGVRQSTNRT